jgi:predicted dehydrogenase
VNLPVRLGYVGAGYLAQLVHLPNFSSLETCRVVALAEVRPRLAELVARRFSIPVVYESHLRLADDPDVDAVAVSASFDRQGEIAADLLRSGKHVFVEKPMAVSVAQARRILDAAEAGNARLMVAYMKRHDPGNVLARAIIRDWRGHADRGEITFVRHHCFGGDWRLGLRERDLIVTDEPYAPNLDLELVPDWLPEDLADAYVLYVQDYTHGFNLVRFLLDADDDARVVSTRLQGDWHTGVAVLEVAGTQTTIETGTLAHPGWDEHTQVYFARGWVRTSSSPLGLDPSHARVDVFEGGEECGFANPLPGARRSWAYREEAAAFLADLASGAPFASSGGDALTDVRLGEEAFKHALVSSELERRSDGTDVG